jgi:hypothetical protein
MISVNWPRNSVMIHGCRVPLVFLASRRFPDWTAELIKELARHGENGLTVVFSISTETSGGKVGGGGGGDEQ